MDKLQDLTKIEWVNLTRLYKVSYKLYWKQVQVQNDLVEEEILYKEAGDLDADDTKGERAKN